MAIVGLVESLLTAKIVDDATDTHSSKTKNQEVKGLLILLLVSLAVWEVVP